MGRRLETFAPVQALAGVVFVPDIIARRATNDGHHGADDEPTVALPKCHRSIASNVFVDFLKDVGHSLLPECV